MQNSLSSVRLVGLSVVAGTLIASGANAQTVSGNALTIEASNGSGNHFSTVALGSFTSGTTNIGGILYPSKSFTIPAQTLFDGLNAVATINSGSIKFVSGSSNLYYQQIQLNINVTAGSTDTTFRLTSGLMSYGPLSAPVSGVASTSGSITDTNSSGLAVYSGLHDLATNGFRANYNGAIPGGSIFQLQRPANSVVTPGGTTSWSTNSGGFQPLPAGVTSMQSQLYFSLTAGDSTGFNSTYTMLPAPASLVGLAGGAFVLARRRR